MLHVSVERYSCRHCDRVGNLPGMKDANSCDLTSVKQDKYGVVGGGEIRISLCIRPNRHSSQILNSRIIGAFVQNHYKIMVQISTIHSA